VTTSTQRRPRSDGERSRRAILEAAGKLATIDGLDGLTIGRLADHIGMSKSGLYAHFGSKEELQLATVAAAEEVFEEDVIRSAAEVPDGLASLTALTDAYIGHVQGDAFPGGCFFNSVIAEFDTRPGRVRDRVAEYLMYWMAEVHGQVVAAQKNGELAADADTDQIVFEIHAALLLANAQWVLWGKPAVFDRARAAIAERIERSRA
jgi:AcrR family transcriptional regulator